MDILYSDNESSESFPEISIAYLSMDGTPKDKQKTSNNNSKNMNSDIVLDPTFFTDKDILDYRCVICRNIPFPKDAKETICCGYLFCDECIYKWLLTNKTCPVCKKKMVNEPEYLKDVKKESKFIYNVLNNLKLKCPNSCTWNGKLEDLNNHLSKCEYTKYYCKYANIGCKYFGLKSEVEKHEKENDEKHLEIITSYLESGESLKTKQIQFDTNKSIKVTCHEHYLKFSKDESNWHCSAADTETGCLSPSPDFKTKFRYRCSKCFYDLCPLCVIRFAKGGSY